MVKHLLESKKMLIPDIQPNILHGFLLNQQITETINTRFGIITPDTANLIYFPYGIIGFADLKRYYLAEMPTDKIPGALLLQSLDDESICFILMPVWHGASTEEPKFFQKEDVIGVANDYGIKSENLYVSAITCIYRENKKGYLSLNLKAPIFFDRKHNIAYQHVLLKDIYQVDYIVK